jgi:hypothetical protein
MKRTRSTQTSSKVTNLPAQRSADSTVTPQRSETSGQRSNRLIAAFNDGIAEVATQPDPGASPIPRRPPTFHEEVRGYPDNAGSVDLDLTEYHR